MAPRWATGFIARSVPVGEQRRSGRNVGPGIGSKAARLGLGAGAAYPPGKSHQANHTILAMKMTLMKMGQKLPSLASAPDAGSGQILCSPASGIGRGAIARARIPSPRSGARRWCRCCRQCRACARRRCWKSCSRHHPLPRSASALALASGGALAGDRGSGARADLSPEASTGPSGAVGFHRWQRARRDAGR
jgi:hypothetical protein